MAKHCNCDRPTGRTGASFAEDIEESVNDAKKGLFFLMATTDGEELHDGQKIGAMFDIVRALSSLECTAQDMRHGVTPEPSPADGASELSNGHTGAEVQ